MKYDNEFKLKVVEVGFARGKVKEVAEEWHRPSNAFYLAFSIQESQSDCIPRQWKKNANRSRERDL